MKKCSIMTFMKPLQDKRCFSGSLQPRLQLIVSNPHFWEDGRNTFETPKKIKGVFQQKKADQRNEASHEGAGLSLRVVGFTSKRERLFATKTRREADEKKTRRRRKQDEKKTRSRNQPASLDAFWTLSATTCGQGQRPDCWWALWRSGKPPCRRG